MTKPLGMTSWRNDHQQMEYLRHLEFSGDFSTGLPFIWGDHAANRFKEIHILFSDVGKGAAAVVDFLISKDGASFSTASIYNTISSIYSATTSALTCTGATGAARAGMFLSGFMGGMCTATANAQPGWGEIVITNPGDTNRTLLSWTWNFCNSTRNPAQSVGAGQYASGPCQGIMFAPAAALRGDFSVFGVRKI